MSWVRFIVGVGIVLVVSELFSRLAEDLTPGTVGKPFSLEFYPTGPVFRFRNDLGNQSPIERGETKRIAIFGNSFSMADAHQSDLWPALLEKEFPGVHIENYSTAGAQYGKLVSLLNFVIRKQERFDALILILNLDSSEVSSKPVPAGLSFDYSNHVWVCSANELCVVTRVRETLRGQWKRDPLLNPSLHLIRRLGVQNASADAVKMSKLPIPVWPLAGITEKEKSKCMVENSSVCENEYTETVRSRMSERADHSVTFDEKMKIYSENFLPCRAKIDLHCDVKRATEPEIFKTISSGEYREVEQQIRILQELVGQISDKVVVVLQPFPISPGIDPSNYASIQHVELSRTKPGYLFLTDEDVLRKVRRADQIQRVALRGSSLTILDLQAPFDVHARTSHVYSDVGHVTKRGHEIAAPMIAEALRKAGMVGN